MAGPRDGEFISPVLGWLSPFNDNRIIDETVTSYKRRSDRRDSGVFQQRDKPKPQYAALNNCLVSVRFSRVIRMAGLSMDRGWSEAARNGKPRKKLKQQRDRNGLARGWETRWRMRGREREREREIERAREDGISGWRNREIGDKRINDRQPQADRRPRPDAQRQREIENGNV